MESLKQAVFQISTFLDRLGPGKNVVCLCGNYGVGKTSLGNLLEKMYEGVVFINADYFRFKPKADQSLDDLEKFIKTYNLVFIKKIVDKFVKNKNYIISTEKGSTVFSKEIKGDSKRILLLEFPFPQHPVFKKLGIDLTVEIISDQIRRPRSVDNYSKLACSAMHIYTLKFYRREVISLLVKN